MTERIKMDKWRANTDGIEQLKQQVRFDVIGGNLEVVPHRLVIKPPTLVERLKDRVMAGIEAFRDF